MPFIHPFPRALRPALIVIACSVLSACASVATFEETDTDGDGAVTREEASSFEPLSSMFNSADDNKDGALDPEEFELAQKVIVGGRRSEPRRRTMTEKGGINDR